mgnify:CR=1 FL=1
MYFGGSMKGMGDLGKLAKDYFRSPIFISIGVGLALAHSGLPRETPWVATTLEALSMVQGALVVLSAVILGLQLSFQPVHGFLKLIAVSVLIRRPIVGYVWSWVNGHDRAWRNARRAVLAFDIATLTWVLVFGSRFLVQRHLYDADQTGWLGVARIAMGWPLTAVAALVTYLAIRSAQRAIHSAHHHETHEHPAVDQTGDDAVLGTEEN